MCSGRREASRQSLFKGGGKQSSHVDSTCMGVSRQCKVLTDGGGILCTRVGLSGVWSGE